MVPVAAQGNGHRSAWGGGVANSDQLELAFVTQREVHAGPLLGNGFRHCCQYPDVDCSRTNVPLTRPRLEVLTAVIDRIPWAVHDDCFRIGVDGVDGAGKTIFANDLADELRRRGRVVVRISVDDFHHPQAVRYRRGRTSAEGFWLDSFDYERLSSDVLIPLAPDGNRRYRPASHDLESDREIRPPLMQAPPGAILVLDGLFLHRDQLVGQWDLSIWLDVPFAVTVARLASRDGGPSDPQHSSLRRYVDAQKHYLSLCDPAARADIVIDNTNPNAPLLLKQPAATAGGTAGDDSTNRE